MAHAYLNGRFVPCAELRLSFADAGFVSGATVTDFCRTYRRKLFRWPDHLARLRRDAEVCHIPLLPSDAELTSAAERLIEAHEGSDDLAVVTFATPGPLAYMTGASDDGPPTLGMHAFPLPKERYRRFFTEGVELQYIGSAGWHSDIVPIQAKHRSRLAWWLASKVTREERIAVLSDREGMGFDTSIGAVVAVTEDVVQASPPVSALDSVSLRVTEELCREVGIGFERASLPFAILSWPPLPDEQYERLDRVTEVMLAGSAFGLAGVRSFSGPVVRREYPWPGPVTRKLQAAWSRLVGVDISAEFG